MPPNESQAKVVETRNPDRSHLIGVGLDPVEMQRRSSEAKRRKREQLAAGPREAIALGLSDDLATLRAAAKKLVADAASDDVKLRQSARKDLGPWLNQALGTIEQRKQPDSLEGDTLPTDREARMRLLAQLEALGEE